MLKRIKQLLRIFFGDSTPLKIVTEVTEHLKAMLKEINNYVLQLQKEIEIIVHMITSIAITDFFRNGFTITDIYIY